jgi:RHS repeat-associated protein
MRVTTDIETGPIAPSSPSTSSPQISHTTWTESSGQVTPYGAPIGSTGSNSNHLLFDGQYLDSESGYLYLRNRLYDPTTSQFVSRDPLSGITGIPYAFADNDPGDKRDDSGLCSLSSLTRAPDYYTASASWPSPLGFIGPGGSVTISRDGGVYWGFDGMVGLPGPSGSLRGGWIDQCAVPTPCQLDSFISGGSLTFSGYVPLGEAANGPAAAATWGHEGQYTLNSTSREVGWGAGPLPAGGLSQSYSQAWFNSGISW